MSERQYSEKRCLSALNYWIKQAEEYGISVTVSVAAKETKEGNGESPPTHPAESKEEVAIANPHEGGPRSVAAASKCADCSQFPTDSYATDRIHPVSGEGFAIASEETEGSSASACAHAKDADAALTVDELQFLRASPRAEHRRLLKQYVTTIPTMVRAVRHAQLRGFNDEAFVMEWYNCMDMSCWADRNGNPVRNWCNMLAQWIKNRELFDKLRDPDRIPDVVSGGNWSGRRSISRHNARKDIFDAKESL